jgi:hypothetical protein
MRYRRRVTDVEAIRWDGRRETQDEITAWGASVRGTDNGALLLFVTKSRANCTVAPGDWVLREPDGSGFYPCAGGMFEASYQAVDDEEPPPEIPHLADPFPGMARAELVRVGFRRSPIGTQPWIWRHGGLSRAELRQGGWEALYTLRVPTPPDEAVTDSVGA